MKLWVALTFLMLAACNYNVSKSAGTKAPISQEKMSNPDFAIVMGAVIGPKCVSCHSNAGGNKGSANLETYEAIRKLYIRVGYRSLETRDMPPGNPLSGNEAKLLERWLDNGMPEKVVGIGEKPSQDLEKGLTNWKKIKEKIFAVKCLDCHQPPTPMGAVDLSDIALVRGLSPRIFASIFKDNSMPVAPYPVMTPVERRVLLKWFDLGMPE